MDGEGLHGLQNVQAQDAELGKYLISDHAKGGAFAKIRRRETRRPRPAARKPQARRMRRQEIGTRVGYGVGGNLNFGEVEPQTRREVKRTSA